MDKNNENYLKIRRAFYQQDMSKEKRYVDKMCDLYFNEKIPFNEVVHLFKVYEENREIPDATGVDFNSSNYNTLSSFIYKISGEDLLRWKMPNIVYEDNENGITISLIRNYEEAKSVLCFNTWCVFNSKDYWITHKQDGDTIYLIKLINDNCSSFYSVRVEKNGQRHYYAYNHTELSNKNENGYPTIDEFEQRIGTNGIKTLIPRMINESKTYKNMNKKVIKINESQLRKMIAESIKKMLKEETEPIAIGSPEDGKGCHVTIAGDSLGPYAEFNVYGVGTDAQAAVDAAVDYLEKNGETGYFWDNEEAAQEYPDDFVAAGNCGHLLRVDLFHVEQM